jgi:hypothetical protein
MIAGGNSGSEADALVEAGSDRRHASGAEKAPQKRGRKGAPEAGAPQPHLSG